MPNIQLEPAQTTSAAGKVAVNQDAGIITTESLATAAGATYTLTIGCSAATPSSIPLVSIKNGSNSTGDPSLSLVAAGAGVITVVISNRSGAAAFNGTLVVSFIVFN